MPEFSCHPGKRIHRQKRFTKTRVALARILSGSHPRGRERRRKRGKGTQTKPS
jgi:hypothetical protein